MKKTNNKKGFTIVELVIVIAVIAILAAVMIPTFGGVIEKAQDSALLQEAQAAYKEMYAEDLSDGKIDGQKDSADITYTTTGTADYDYDENTETVTFTFTKDDRKVTCINGTWSDPTDVTNN